MNRAQYRTARRLFRDNGACSFRWMTSEAYETVVYGARMPLGQLPDHLAERQRLALSEHATLAFMFTTPFKVTV